MSEERMQVRLEQEPEPQKKPGFFARHRRGITTALAAAGGAILTFAILALFGKDGKDTLDCAQEAWELKQFQDSVGNGESFDGSGL